MTIQDTFTQSGISSTLLTNKYSNIGSSTDVAPTDVSLTEPDSLARRWIIRNRTTEFPISSVPNDRGDETSSTNLASMPRRHTSELVVGLKKWVGVIREIGDGIFTAELTPLDHEGPQLLADFELRLLAPDDANVELGDVVYLTTRYVRNRSGYPTATTQLRLRRLGEWSPEQLAAIKKQAWHYAEELNRYAE